MSQLGARVEERRSYEVDRRLTLNRLMRVAGDNRLSIWDEHSARDRPVAHESCAHVHRRCSPARALDPSSHLAPASPRVGLGKEGGERSGAKRARRGSEARSRARAAPIAEGRRVYEPA